MKHFSFSLFILFFNYSFSQQSKIDSLLSLLKKDKQDTNKVIHLNALGWEFKNRKPDTSIILGNQALSLAEKSEWKKGIANSLGNLGSFNYLKGDFPRALENYFKALKIDEEIQNKRGIAKRLGNIGTVYHTQGDYPKALDSDFKALKMAEEFGDKQLQANILGNIGNIYNKQKDYLKTLDYDFKALKMNEELGNKNGTAINLGNIGIIYDNQKDYPKALDYYFKALKMDEELGNKNGAVVELGNIGIVYYEQKYFDKALDYIFKALKMNEELGNKTGIAINIGNIGELYTNTKKYAEAEKYLLDALKMDKEIGALNNEMDVENHLTDLYTKTNRYQLALEHYKKAMVLKDTLFNAESSEKIANTQFKYQQEKKDKIRELEERVKESEHKAEVKQQKIITWSVVGGLLLVILFAGFIFRSLRITRKQKQIIEVQKTEVEKSKHIIEEKNKDITDSINYAKRIQKAMLPHRRDIWAAFPQSFVLFKPKDIVRGVFYFFHKKDKYVFIAACDCTGHGVPGAFMSMIGSDKLEDAVLQSSDTSEILSLLNKGVKTALKQSDGGDATRDGMDLAFCSVDTKNRIVKYVGANRPFWLIRKGGTAVEEIKATKKAIGGFTEDSQHYDTHEIKLQQGDTFYLSTDGYGDTFSGQGSKKLTTKKFKEILLSIQHKTMKEQEKHLDSFIEDWKAGTEQVDDILVIGVRL